MFSGNEFNNKLRNDREQADTELHIHIKVYGPFISSR